MKLERWNWIKNPTVLPSDEYVHYIVIGANYLLTWFSFSLFLSLKNKTTKTRNCDLGKRTEKTSSTYFLNQEDAKPAPAEWAHSGRKRSVGSLKTDLMHTSPGRGEANRPLGSGRFQEGRAWANPSPIHKQGKKSSLSDQNTNIPKRKTAENREGLRFGWWGDTLP